MSRRYGYRLGSIAGSSFNSMMKEATKNRLERELNEKKEEAETINNSIKNNLYLYENVSKENLQLVKFNCDEYYSKMMTELVVNEYVPLDRPDIDEEKKKFGLKKENKLLEMINNDRKEERINKEKEFKKYWEKINEEYDKAEENNKIGYEKYLENVKDDYRAENSEIIEKTRAYLRGDSEEFKEIFQNNLEIFKPSFNSIKKIYFDYNNKVVYLDLEFINPDSELKNVKEVRFIQSRMEMKQIPYTLREQEDIYEKIVFGTIMYIAIKISYFFEKMVDRLIINGFVNKVNTVKGVHEDVYFVSVDLNSNDIPYDNLKYINPKDYLDSKGARYLTPLRCIKPVNIKKLENGGVDDVIASNISGIDFEHISKSLLEKNGFEDVVVTQASGDYGADVIATKEGVKYAIQCKKYSSKVGVEAVQEVIASKSVYNCHVGVVLTNNYFTPNAKKLAESNGILLWDANKLQELINKSNDKEKTDDVVEEIIDE